MYLTTFPATLQGVKREGLLLTRLTCEVSSKFYAASDVEIFITHFFRKNGKKAGVKFWDT